MFCLFGAPELALGVCEMGEVGNVRRKWGRGGMGTVRARMRRTFWGLVGREIL